jgi:hypothetical protein
LLNAESASTGEIIVTNDGATILKSISLDNPAAKILVNISKVQDDEVGDGTTSVCVLASELLREGERLVNMKIHPQTIIEGYRIASKAALDALEAAAQDHSCVLPSSPCRLAWAAIALREAASLSSPPLASLPPFQRRRRRLPDRPRQHRPDDALVKGPLGEQGLLCQPRRRRRPPAQGPSTAVHPARVDLRASLARSWPKLALTPTSSTSADRPAFLASRHVLLDRPGLDRP